MTIALSQDSVDFYAREADRKARGMQQYGGNAALVQLRCFKYYHPDQGSFITTPEGRQRWLGPKASRIYAILDRASSSTNRLTMGAIASEAMASTSTVSRTVQRLQAFGLFAIDVTRGRHGGIYVRKRHVGDHLRHYAQAAWRRIRAWINVASTPKDERERLRQQEQDQKKVTETVLVTMDATFSEAWDAAERRGRLLAAEIASDTAPAADRGPRAFDPGRLTAANVIAERAWLDEHDPDWDLELEKVRDSYGIG